MQLCKVRLANGTTLVGTRQGESIACFDGRSPGGLAEILHADDPPQVVRDLLEHSTQVAPRDVTFLAPLDQQEVWAAGVTYKRSQEARERESAGAARFYDLVYDAPRPELFFKAMASRVVGNGGRVRIRQDSKWSVPEPELALVISPNMRIVGYTIGNDMSARDIEGENPLYLPQAKIYDQSCSLGPVVTLAGSMPPLDKVSMRLTIERAGRQVFEGSTTAGSMNRKLEDLVHWLGLENTFPHGAVLLTGTGIVPPDDFALERGDVTRIDISGIGTLLNVVECREA